jgi:hypothetical protein
MGRMREQVREHNVYRWAGDLIGELTGIRLGKAAAAPAMEFEEMAVGGQRRRG